MAAGLQVPIKINKKDYEFVNVWLCCKTKPLISPSGKWSSKWLNWCRKCSVPIHEQLRVSHLGYPRLHSNCKHVHSCPNSCRINQKHTSTHVLESNDDAKSENKLLKTHHWFHYKGGRTTLMTKNLASASASASKTAIPNYHYRTFSISSLIIKLLPQVLWSTHW
jgi:hypothetical protein